jgi:hypothetical protein
LLALLARFLGDAGLCGTVGRLARAHVLEHHGLDQTVRRLAEFLAEVHARREELAAAVAGQRPAEDGLEAYLLDELRFGVHDLGLTGLPLHLEDVVGGLVRGRP